ncbi:Acg family FMN-binding oxidoreductase [Erythrobacter sp. NE805]|uniref:Acg family FMN-binding oxidoreductase n=1 Tax=Erythrobacter sp. NE805 TaxID=3389875 RepID=UPI00396B3AD8
MEFSRRKVLVAGGAAAVVTLAGGWRALTTPALAEAAGPWRRAGKGFADPRLDALSYAILAPNPHNRQPWRFTLVGGDTIDVACDLARRLPATDPFDRQIVIGFGCMLELLRIAAAERGYTATITPFPDGEDQPRLAGGRIARVRFVKGAAVRDPLFGAVLARRSTKEPFLERPVADAEVAALASALPAGVALGHSTPANHAALSANAIGAWETEQATPATRRESIALMRIGNAAVVAQPDGIDLGSPFMTGAGALGIVTPTSLDTPGSMAFQSGIDMYRSLVAATPRWVWLTTPGNTRADQLVAGAAWVRLNLAANARGLAVHPWSQALQEFPEMQERYRELRGLAGAGERGLQMFARLGFGPAVDPSPRWPLETKLVDV